MKNKKATLTDMREAYEKMGPTYNGTIIELYDYILRKKKKEDHS